MNLIEKAPEETTRRLAEDIKARTNGLNNEDKLAEGVQLRSYARAKKYREQDRARINGMTIALTYLLGDPLNMGLAQKYIDAL